MSLHSKKKIGSSEPFATYKSGFNPYQEKGRRNSEFCSRRAKETEKEARNSGGGTAGMNGPQNPTSSFSHIPNAHQILIESLYKIFKTNPETGLEDSQVSINRDKYGQNVFSNVKKPNRLLEFFKCLVCGPFEFFLWAASVVCFFFFALETATSISTAEENLHMAFLLIGIVVLEGSLRFYQESKLKTIINSFRKLMPHYAIVIRSGRTRMLSVEELVVGDIVAVRCGDKIPADIRIIEAHVFKVDNSSLTGESKPEIKIPVCTHTNPLETKNLAFFSARVVEGCGKGVVVGVGDKTLMGETVRMTSVLTQRHTTLSMEMSHFVTVLCWIAVLFGLLSLTISLVIQFSPMDTLTFLIAVLLTNVPFGVACFIPICLAISAKRLARRNCLVKNLEAVETLGSVNVLCTDKTATLTQNTLTVSHLWFNGNELVVESSDLTPDFNLDTTFSSGFRTLATTAILCNNAIISPGQEDLAVQDQVMEGDAIDCAVLKYVESHGINSAAVRKKYIRRMEIPFNSTNKFHACVYEQVPEFSEDSSSGRFLVAMKGAPEKILEMCSRVLVDEREYDLDDGWKQKIQNMQESLCRLGERVLGFADLQLTWSNLPEENFELSEDNLEFLSYGFRFVGLLSMIDPPRPGAREAILQCREAGIKCVMITGDHPIAAKAIARHVGIFSPGKETIEELADRLLVSIREINPEVVDAIVINGNQLKYISPQALSTILRNHQEIIFARMLPSQKLQVVEAFQNAGAIVAVTGDGVNDAPALKKANIGISMGLSGTDIAKDSADMILQDDNFCSIVIAIQEGRRIFDNLKKCCFFGLTDTMPCVLSFIMYMVLRIPNPLQNIAMVLIAIGIDFLPAISLAFEKAEDGILTRPPRNVREERLINKRLISSCYGQFGLIEACAGFFSYIVVLSMHGFPPKILLGIQKRWNSQAVNDLEDVYGEEWSYCQRLELTRIISSAVFVSIAMCQIANVITLKSRRTTLWHHGFFGNYMLNLAIVLDILFVAFLVYTPGMSIVGMGPLKWFMWFLPLPFVIIILLWGQLSRLILTHFPNSWLSKEFLF